MRPLPAALAADAVVAVIGCVWPLAAVDHSIELGGATVAGASLDEVAAGMSISDAMELADKWLNLLPAAGGCSATAG